MGAESSDAERVIRRIDPASWLPHGRAEIVLSRAIPRPAGLVRVLLRRGGEVFCRPREDGRQDLPTRLVGADDPSGSTTVARLATELGIAPESLRPLGFVRNVVPPPAPDYPWPTPLAHFHGLDVGRAPDCAGPVGGRDRAAGSALVSTVGGRPLSSAPPQRRWQVRATRRCRETRTFAPNEDRSPTSVLRSRHRPPFATAEQPRLNSVVCRTQAAGLPRGATGSGNATAVTKRGHLHQMRTVARRPSSVGDIILIQDSTLTTAPDGVLCPDTHVIGASRLIRTQVPVTEKAILASGTACATGVARSRPFRSLAARREDRREIWYPIRVEPCAEL